MFDDRVQQYTAQIKQFQQQLKALHGKGKKVVADAVDGLESRVALSEGCLAQELQKQAGKAWSDMATAVTARVVALCKKRYGVYGSVWMRPMCRLRPSVVL